MPITPKTGSLFHAESHLGLAERTAREGAYGNMVWVVDGLRLVRDEPRFKQGSKLFEGTSMNGLYITAEAGEAFPPGWLACAAPVFFDFSGPSGYAQATRATDDALWCLLPGRALGRAVVLCVSKTAFVRTAIEKAEFFPARQIIQVVERRLLERHRQERAAQLHSIYLPTGWRPQRRRRRF